MGDSIGNGAVMDSRFDNKQPESAQAAERMELPGARQSALRLSQNPYATHFYSPEDTDEAMMASVKEQLRRSEDPYAWHYYMDGQIDAPITESTGDASAPIPVQRPTATITEFEAGCRAVFRPYIPALENGRLRPHHQDFIRRNRARSPEARFEILERLRRYDLSAEPGLRTHFNREEDAFTEDKLLQIEKAVTDD